MQMMVETWSGKSINVEGSDRWQIIDLERSGQHLSSLETLNFRRKQTNLAFDM